MKPLTRKEMLLDGVAKGNLDTFKPATREEVFMKKAIDSKCLPVMTVNAIGNADDNTVTMDKTYSELREHIDNGGEVNYLFHMGTNTTAYKLYLAENTNTMLQFMGFKTALMDDGTGLKVSYLKSYIVRITNYYTSWVQCDITLTA